MVVVCSLSCSSALESFVTFHSHWVGSFQCAILLRWQPTPHASGSARCITSIALSWLCHWFKYLVTDLLPLSVSYPFRCFGVVSSSPRFCGRVVGCYVRCVRWSVFFIQNDKLDRHISYRCWYPWVADADLPVLPYDALDNDLSGLFMLAEQICSPEYVFHLFWECDEAVVWVGFYLNAIP